MFEIPIWASTWGSDSGSYPWSSGKLWSPPLWNVQELSGRSTYKRPTSLPSCCQEKWQKINDISRCEKRTCWFHEGQNLQTKTNYIQGSSWFCKPLRIWCKAPWSNHSKFFVTTWSLEFGECVISASQLLASQAVEVILYEWLLPWFPTKTFYVEKNRLHWQKSVENQQHVKPLLGFGSKKKRKLVLPQVCHLWNQIRTPPPLWHSRNEGQPQSQDLTLRFERCTGFSRSFSFTLWNVQHMQCDIWKMLVFTQKR